MNLIAPLISPDTTLLDISFTSKKKLFEHAADLFAQTQGLKAADIFTSLFERERLGSTALGHGIAIPHGRIKGLKDAVAAFVPAERIVTDPLRLLAYGTDASFYRLIPRVVVRPKDSAEVRELLAWAQQHDVVLALDAAASDLATPMRRAFGVEVVMANDAVAVSLALAAAEPALAQGLAATIMVGHGVGMCQTGAIGRALLSEILPVGLPFATINKPLKKKEISRIINASFRRCGLRETVIFADKLMYTGFTYATRAGISIGIDDMVVPAQKSALVKKAEKAVIEVQQQYQDGAITHGERDWGVTVLEATGEMDAGPVWASVGFPMRDAAKGSVYRNEVTAAALLEIREAGPGSRDDHDLAACLCKPVNLADRRLDVTRVGVGHGLHHNRRPAAHDYIADFDSHCLLANNLRH